MSTGVALVRLTEVEGRLFEVLEHARGEGTQVVIIDGTAGTAACALDDGDLWRLERFALPLVFAAGSVVRGVALDIAVLADIRVCEAGTLFSTDTRASARLAVLLRTETPPIELSAESAWLAGFVSQVTVAGASVAAAERIAAVVASRGPIATRLAKESVWRGLPQGFEQALRFETDLTLLLQTTKDRAEGVRAFVEKRPPAFTGE